MFNFNWNKRNTIIVVSIAVYAVLALTLMIIINNKAISAWINSILSVLAPLIVGCAIAYLCAPILNGFERKIFRKISSKHIRRVLSIICTYMLIFLGFTAVLLIIIPQLIKSFSDFASNIDAYGNQVISYINSIISRFDSSPGADQLGEYINWELIYKEIAGWVTFSADFITNIKLYIDNYGIPIFNFFKNFVLGFFISIYILSSKERLAAQCKKFFAAFLKKEKYDSLIEWAHFSSSTFGRYIKAQLLDALIVTVECAIIFSIAGIPYALLISFIIGVTNIIPVFGPFIGGIPAGFIVLIADPSKVWLFLLFLIIIQQIDGNFVLPKLVGSTTGMSSLGVLCSIIIMGGYFGVIGMILGVPVFAVISELIRRIVNGILVKKDMPVSLAEYYAPEAVVINDDLEHPKEKILSRFFAKTTETVKKIYRKIFPGKNNKNKK